jgi:hypothetical protein
MEPSSYTGVAAMAGQTGRQQHGLGDVGGGQGGSGVDSKTLKKAQENLAA